MARVQDLFINHATNPANQLAEEDMVAGHTPGFGVQTVGGEDGRRLCRRARFGFTTWTRILLSTATAILGDKRTHYRKQLTLLY